MAKTRAGNPFPSSRPVRLLIVEDNPADVELMVAILKRAGYALMFDVVDSPELFQQRLAEADYDAILSDHNLRTWRGMDALETLQKSQKDIPFIVVTATLGDEAAVEYVKQGAADYVLKHRLERLPVALGNTLRDKTQREQAARLQEEILCAKREWELTFDTVADLVFLLDEQNCIRRANRAAAEVLGLAFSQLIGQPCYKVIHGLDEPRPECPHCLLLKTGQEEHGDFQEPRLGRFFNATATPLRDPTGVLRGCVLVMRDITERKRLEEQLRQTQKMEAVGRLAGGVAHDFNNLLNVIVGYAELQLDGVPPDDPAHKKAEEILKAGERAASLTRQLLAFSRKQVLEPKVLDLNIILAESDKMLQRLIGEDIELVSLPGPALGRVKADPGQIEQIIMNLAINARDAMPQGGKLTIETANVELDEAYTRQHMSVQPGPYVMLAVSDSGLGMDEETRSHIFEPFFTTKQLGQGTGLGLATVHGVVKQSGGCIWVYSEPGHGTTFKIYLPRVEGAVEALEPGEATARPLGGSETVLLVEDEESVRGLVRESLERHGYTVLEARDGADALHLCQERKGPIHLVLTDVVMPGRSGYELARHLASVRSDMKVLYMSGYTDNAIAHHGVLERGLAFLQKPFRPIDLARKVREVLDAEKLH